MRSPDFPKMGGARTKKRRVLQKRVQKMRAPPKKMPAPLRPFLLNRALARMGQRFLQISCQISQDPLTPISSPPLFPSSSSSSPHHHPAASTSWLFNNLFFSSLFKQTNNHLLNDLFSSSNNKGICTCLPPKTTPTLCLHLRLHLHHHHHMTRPSSSALLSRQR